MLVSPTEPARIKAIGEVSGLPERYGCDILITEGESLTGIQRKAFPEDLMASLSDGRLTNQLRQMEGKIDRKLVILEGFGQWTLDGELVGWRTFTKHQMFGLIYSLAFEFGVEVLRVRDMNETIEALEELEVWAGKEQHISLLNRPGPKKDGWGKTSSAAEGIHILQGFRSVGVGTAQKMIEHCGGKIPLQWTFGSAKELEAIPGIGKGRAKALWEALNESDV